MPLAVDEIAQPAHLLVDNMQLFVDDMSLERMRDYEKEQIADCGW